ncbi:hypothetical protein HA402_000464 [Bradysia odoriphaga]|nr:hypothetical protein HA402_000464 [Bradysia odoriphaga]
MDPSMTRYALNYLYFARDELPLWYYRKSKCSIFRGIILCLCLNITYANVVRFPRELERHGTAFLIPYFTILLLIGLPIVLFEIAIGQFLGQGSAHSWRASPIFKGASVVGRLSSWLTTIWTSLQAVVAVVYVGELIFRSVPFSQCASKVRLEADVIKVYHQLFRICRQTFLTPVWEHTLYFALLTMSLIVLWIVSMICTYSSKTLRRSIVLIGLCTLMLLVFQTGWSVTHFISKTILIEVLPFRVTSLLDSAVWFSALLQVIYSTSVGFGVWPVVTGKFLYKGDAVRTSVVYLCFNLFVITLSVTFFVTQYNNPITQNSTINIPELKPLTSIYDTALSDPDPLLSRLIPGLAYIIVVLTSIITISINIYTASRLSRRHPNYILSLTGLVTSITALIYPDFFISRLLDRRIVGVLVICALIVEKFIFCGIYGVRNIYTDLEFSIGRPIMKLWVFLWCTIPFVLSGLLIWWSISYSPDDLAITYLPRWAPVVLSVIIILVLACVEVYKQVDYNCCSMIQEAAQPSKDWGPADPIVRHAWKQWRAVCEDTGQKDFTLRRRGTRDYTHSIKKGQYSRGKYGTQQNVRHGSTPGSNSPNYSGSIFEDSAIEEDVSSDKYHGYQGQMNGFANGTKPLRTSNGSRNTLTSNNSRRNTNTSADKALVPTEQPKQFFYIRSANENDYNNVSKVEIVSAPPATSQATHNYRKSAAKNPLARVDSNPNYSAKVTVPDTGYGNFKKDSHKDGNNVDHICWRKFSINSEEFSTEL